ncbi:MAG TPA: MauE/DoxX family redox-associated membrane protein [Acidimicrobiales bacterium]|nr:MauE/DoxX family redox-associated membrane protein [Acidimicrobiales bacterium]
MDGFGYACALVLAAVFVRAGAAKLARPTTTATSFVALGVPAAGLAARAVPIVELLVAVALLAAPRVGALGALALLIPFTGVLARAVRSGSGAPCNCFGAARVDPVSTVDVVRNVLLVALGLTAVTATMPVVPGPAAVVATVIASACGLALLSALRTRARYQPT